MAVSDRLSRLAARAKQAEDRAGAGLRGSGSVALPHSMGPSRRPSPSGRVATIASMARSPSLKARELRVLTPTSGGMNVPVQIAPGRIAVYEHRRPAVGRRQNDSSWPKP